MSETDILREALTKLLRGAGVAKLGLARDGVQHAKLVQMEGIATTALAAPRDTGTEAVLEDAIAFIESLAVVPLLMSDDIKMRLQDVQAHARVEAASLRKRLTDRATRPAEPASPVAEAGDGEASRYIAKCREMSKGENGHTYTWWSRLAELLSTLEAERARADAAEQRAADALARAEKAQVALLSVREAMLMARDVLADPSTIGIDDVVWMPEAVSMNETLHDYLERAAEFAARASREAQPATDGGDDG